MKLLYVVHRYPPYQGGSEYYVQAMAEESIRRGHDVTVFTGAAKGDSLNGVKIRTDTEVVEEPFDLIIVHGADVGVQNFIHLESKNIKSPILYLIIKPTESYAGKLGMDGARYLGCSTQEDFRHCVKFGYEHKIVSVRHSIPSVVSDTIGNGERFRKKYGITTPHLFVSAGGFWRHKGMDELVQTFRSLPSRDNVSLVLLGYANPELAPDSDESANILSFLVDERQDVLDAIDAADLYIMNSTEEGFGLVLLEAMLNKTPWASRRIAGAVELQQYGFTYDTQGELKTLMEGVLCGVLPTRLAEDNIEIGHKYVLEHRTIKNTVDDIEAVLKKCHP